MIEQKITEYAFANLTQKLNDANQRIVEFENIKKGHLEIQQSQSKHIEHLTHRVNILDKARLELLRELDQQKFNNKHNLSIDQKVADKISKLEDQLSYSRDVLGAAEDHIKKAESLIEDFTLESEHATFCRFLSGECTCMDRTYFNKNNLLKLAKEFLKYGEVTK